MSPTRIFALYIRQFYLIRDNPTRLIQIFGWVLFDIVLWGFLSQYIARLVGGSTNFTPLFLGAVLVWYFATRSMHGVATAFFEDVWSRNFLNLFASPLRTSEYVIALVLTGMTTSLMGFASMIVVAKALFGFSITSYGVYVLPLLLIIFLSGIALGIVGAAIVMRFGPAAEWFIWPIPEMLSPVVGVFYPLAVLPLWLQTIAHILPPSYVFESIRAILSGTAVSELHILFAIALSLVYCALAYALFISVYKKAVKQGLIARYSSESF
jgi:ABC-2 type transport system permease protein